jgi:hypothetical protein
MSSFKRQLQLLAVVLPLALAVPATVEAQQPPAAGRAAAGGELTDERLTVYVRAFLGERKVQDEFDPQLAAVRNKQDEAQKLLREQRKQAVAKVLADNGMTEQEFAWITYVVSTNQERREAFEKMLTAAKATPAAPTP